MSEDSKADIKKPTRGWLKRKIRPSIGAARVPNKVTVTEKVINVDERESEVETPIKNIEEVDNERLTVEQTVSNDDQQTGNGESNKYVSPSFSNSSSENKNSTQNKKRIPKRQRFTPTINTTRAKKEPEKPITVIPEARELAAIVNNERNTQAEPDEILLVQKEVIKVAASEQSHRDSSSSSVTVSKASNQKTDAKSDDRTSSCDVEESTKNIASATNNANVIESPVKSLDATKSQPLPIAHKKKRYPPNLGPNVRQRSHPSYGYHSDEDGSQSEGYISDNPVEILKRIPDDAFPKGNPVVRRPTEVDVTDTSKATIHDLLYSNPSNGVEMPTEEVRDTSVAEKTFEELSTAQISSRDGKTDVKESSTKMSKVDEVHDVMAPQVKLGPDGSIILNEESLYIQQTGADKDMSKTELVFEEGLSTSRRKTQKARKWGIDDTLALYKALSQVGTDFSLVAQMIPQFTRNQIKKKFKREEKLNGDLIDRALSNRLPIDSDLFKSNTENCDETLNEE